MMKRILIGLVVSLVLVACSFGKSVYELEDADSKLIMTFDDSLEHVAEVDYEIQQDIDSKVEFEERHGEQLERERDLYDGIDGVDYDYDLKEDTFIEKLTVDYSQFDANDYDMAPFHFRTSHTASFPMEEFIGQIEEIGLEKVK